MAQTFVYRVRDRFGRAHDGKIEAETSEAVVERLRQDGYIVTNIKEKKAALSLSDQIARLKSLNAKDLSIFCRQFATMISAGVPMLKILTILMEQSTKPKLTEALEEVRRDVESGSTLSNALGKHPNLFPEIMMSMIRAGETGGTLDESLERLSVHFEKEYELRERIKTASRYPTVVFGLAVVAVIIMMAFVIPTFAEMLNDMGVEIPLPTRILLAVSGIVSDYVVLIFIGLVLGVLGGLRYIKSPQGKKRFDEALFKIPVVRDITIKVATARLSRTLSTLMRSGVPIIQAIEVAEDTAGNAVVVKGLAGVKDSVRMGEGLSGPLKAAGVFPIMVTQMTAVGEETGDLDSMLDKVADYYEKEVRYMVDNLSTLIEPVLIVFLGCVVGGMIASVMLPMLSIYDSVGK